MSKQVRVWTGTQWDTLAVTLPDLSNYSTTTQMNTAIDNAKGLVYITGSTFSSASTVNISNCFSSTYDNYRVELHVTSVSASCHIQLRWRNSGGDVTTAKYGYRAQHLSSFGTGGDLNQLGRSQSLAYLTGDTIGSNGSYGFDVIAPNLAQMTGAFGQAVANNVGNLVNFANGFEATDVFTGFSILPSTGNITGTIRIYGYRNS